MWDGDTCKNRKMLRVISCHKNTTPGTGTRGGRLVDLKQLHSFHTPPHRISLGQKRDDGRYIHHMAGVEAPHRPERRQRFFYTHEQRHFPWRQLLYSLIHTRSIFRAWILDDGQSGLERILVLVGFGVPNGTLYKEYWRRFKVPTATVRVSQIFFKPRDVSHSARGTGFDSQAVPFDS